MLCNFNTDFHHQQPKICQTHLKVLKKQHLCCPVESFKAIKTVRISKFIWQRVPDCRTSVIKSPTVVRAKSAARNSETIQVSGSHTKTAMEQHQKRLGWVISEVPRISTEDDGARLQRQAVDATIYCYTWASEFIISAHRAIHCRSGRIVQ